MEIFFGRMDIGVEYGMDVAVFLENLKYWSEKNASIQENFIDGRYWVYHTLSGFAALYPIWSRDQVKRIIAKCKDAGLILVADYNNDPYKRTKWYSLSDKALDLFGIEVTPDGLWRNRPIDGRNRHVDEGETAKCDVAISPHDIEVKDQKERIEKKDHPISPQGDSAPDVQQPKPKRKRAPKSVPSWMPERFEGFWAAYPRDEDRARAVEQWDKLPQDRELVERYGSEDSLLHDIALGLKRHLECEDWREGRGIPYAFRWLRDRRWLEKRKVPRAGPGGAPEVTYGWR